MRNYAGSALMLFVTMAAALGSYTVNLRVSAERAAVDDLRQQLVADARDVRNLQAELGTRARLPEMQRWNDNVLLMAAPAAGQYLRSPVQLAGYGAAPPAPEAGAPPVQFAVAGSATPALAGRGAVIRTAARSDAPVRPATAGIIRAAYAPPAPAVPAPVEIAAPLAAPLAGAPLADAPLVVGGQ